ncbi:MAG TPA: alpha/beta hydrolase-fold protein [Polyangia bacterium]|nr:alpha/beta hydrolase-fold protein [Polyangia bacterium]
MSTVVTVEMQSAALDRHVSYTAVVPDAGEPPFAVLYQLHGYTDDHRAWLHRANLLRHLARWPLVAILPSGENSYYTGAIETFVMRDLPAHVRRTFNVRDGKAAIGGLSMGGYGAIRLGLKYPDRFASIVAHSSRLPARDELPSLNWTRGLPLDDLDVDALASRAAARPLPRLAFDCGTEDHLLADSRRFHALLTQRNVAHDYAEHPGAHTWDYWDAHVPRALELHAAALGLAPATP